MAPEYANTGMLNEKSDIYSFGVLLLEAVTGRDPVDYGRPASEVVPVSIFFFLHLHVLAPLLVVTSRAHGRLTLSNG